MQGSIGLAVFVGSWVLVAFGYSGGKVKKNVMGFCAAVASMIPFAYVVSEKPKEPIKPLIVITASMLWREYAENEVAAEQKFRGNFVKIGGVVQRVGNEDGELAVLLEGVNTRTSVAAFLDRHQEAKAETIRRGGVVALICGGAKMVNGNPALRGCRIVD